MRSMNRIYFNSGEHLREISNIIDLHIERERAKEEEEYVEFLGISEPIKKVFTQIRKMARTDLPVLILGETGTGKELAARAIHETSLRKVKPFVPINCAAIPETLLEAELFGYEKGTYTGALTSKEGKIQSADGGTIFLDEVAEFPPNLQSKLLRFLDDQMLERVGSRENRKVDVRVLAATNCDLESSLSNGRFRADFYYRLKVLTIKLAPLRDRGTDKLILADYFLKKCCRDMDIPFKSFTKDAIKAIDAYSWPGNVRELINKIQRALVMSYDGLISTEDLELEGAVAFGRDSLVSKKDKIERDSLLDVLIDNGFNISQTARAFNVSRPYVYGLMKKYDIMKGSGNNKRKERDKRD